MGQGKKVYKIRKKHHNILAANFEICYGTIKCSKKIGEDVRFYHAKGEKW